MKQMETAWRLLADGVAILTALLLFPVTLILWVLGGLFDWWQKAWRAEVGGGPSTGMSCPTVQGVFFPEYPLHDEGETKTMKTDHEAGEVAREGAFLAGLDAYAGDRAISFSAAEAMALWRVYCRHYDGQEHEWQRGLREEG